MKRIALLGMPNTGKSTLFNRLSGASARVGNWPGITVDLMSAKILTGGHIAELVDLPGLYDLHGFSDDEQVVRHFLSNNEIDLACIVVNSTQIERQLSLALQIRGLDIPAILLLNMQDESKRAGVTIDVEKMAEKIQMPVVQISAKYAEGWAQMLHTIAETIENNTKKVSAKEVASRLEVDTQIESEMQSIVQETVQIPTTLNNQTTDNIDKVLLHPWFGLPIFVVAIFLLFQFIFTVGAPLQDAMAWLFDQTRSSLLEPLLATTPVWLNGLLLDGIYNGVSTVAAFVPIIVLFFLVMSMVEDSGYLSRAAFLMDALMAKLGLDGRGFVMVLMGFG
ncbi:MAG TPA: ferrous iron transporter B, partial [Methylophilaceae bacterium]|nr:ferrous iron transporter B [Methylophilaceae bacterium]